MWRQIHWIKNNQPLLNINVNEALSRVPRMNGCVHYPDSYFMPLNHILCLNCSLKLFISSNYGKQFETLLNNKDNSISTRLRLLNCFIEMVSYPQIQNFISRDRKCFIRLFGIIFNALDFLVPIVTDEMSSQSIKDLAIVMLSVYCVFRKCVLEHFTKSRHLRWIMLCKRHWNKFILKPFAVSSLLTNVSDKESFHSLFATQFIAYAFDKKNKVVKTKRIKKCQSQIQEIVTHSQNAEVFRNINNEKVSFVGKKICKHQTKGIGFKRNKKNIADSKKRQLMLYRQKTKCNNHLCNKYYLKCIYNVKKMDNCLGAFMPTSLKKKAKFYICKGCHLVYYCSKHCQKIDWLRNDHKTFCNSVVIST
eukprot:134928_1